MKAMKAQPAMVLAAALPVLIFLAAMARPGVATAVQANGLVIGSVVLLFVGKYAGGLVAKAKGGLTDAAVAGLGVGVVHLVVAIVLFGYAASMTSAIGAPGGLLDQGMLQTVAAIAGAVIGAGSNK